MKKHMLPGTIALAKKFFLAIVVFILFNSSNSIFAQGCGWSGPSTQQNLFGGLGTPPCGSASTVTSIGSGTYTYWTGYLGSNYTFSTCGDGYDTQLTLYYFDGSSWVFQAYDDDNGPSCSGLNASLNWTNPNASSTNYLLVLNEYNCLGWNTGASHLLTYVENPPSAPSPDPSGGTNICFGIGTNVTLNRNSSPPTGLTYYWQTSSSGTSTTIGSGATLTVSPTSTTTYYVRPMSGSGCWGTASAGTTITLDPTPSASTAGPDQANCNSGSFTLGATAPSVGVGAWSVVTGTASIANTALRNSGITGVPAGTSATLRWTVSNGSCPPSTDDVILTNSAAAIANAGGPDAVCQSSTPYALSGASVGGSATTGAWSIVSGSGTLSSASQTASPATVTFTPTASGTVVLRLTTNTPANCPAVSADRTVTVSPAAFVVAGGPDAVCQSSTPYALSGASLSGSATTGAWSIVSGSGTLSSTLQTANPALVTFTPTASGTVVLRLTSNTPAGCPAVTADRTVTVSPAPTVNAGGPDAVCQSSTPYALSGATVGGGASTGAWSIVSGSGTLSSASQTATPATVTFTPTTSGTVVLRLTTNTPTNCSAISADRTITVSPAAFVVAGGPDAVCQSSTPYALSGASLSGSATTGAWSIVSGSGTLSSTLQTANPALVTFTPTTSGTVVLRLTSNTPTGCPAVTADRTVTVSPAPTVNAGGPDVACQFSTPFALSGATVGGGASTGAWSIVSGSGTLSSASQTATPAAVTFTPTSSGTVTLRLTTNTPTNCSAISADRTITVNPAATANAGSAQTVCQGGTVNLAGTLGGSAVSSTWTAPTGVFSDATSLTSTYTPSISSGTVTLTLTTNDPDGVGPCTGGTSTVIITVNQAPTVSAGSAQTVCGGGTITLAGTIGGSASSATWSAGSGSFSNAGSLTSTYTPSITSGTITLTLTTNDPDGAGPCAPVSSTVLITVNPAATANAGSAQTVCQGGTVNLAGSLGGSAVSSTWTAPTGVFSDATSLTSTYTPSISSGTVTLTLTTNDPDGAGPCTGGVSTVIITINQAPTVSAGSAQTVCGGGTITLAGTIGGSASSATWSAGSGSFSNAGSLTSTYTPSISFGTVTLTLTTNDPDGAGPCSAVSSTVVITVNQAATANAGVPQTTCQGNTIILTGAIGGSATSSTWSAPNGTFSDVTSLGSSYTPSIASGAVTITLVTNDPDGSGPCPAASSTVDITVNQAATANAGTAQTVCQSGTVTLAGSIGGSATSSTWSALSGTFSNTGLLTSTYSPSITSGTVTLTLTTDDPDGVGPCSAVTSNVVITVTPLPQINSVPSTDVLCNGGNTGTITVNAASGTPPFSYSIDGGVTFQSSNVFTGLLIGSYNVVVTDAQTCSRTYASNPVVIGQPTTVTHTVTLTDASCSNVFDGKIVVSSTGGVLPYAYSLNGGPSQTSSTFTGLSSGAYVVYTIDANGCIFTTNDTIHDSYNVVGSIVSQNNVSCFGGVDGAVTVQIVGGIPPYSYSINGVTYQASSTFTGLASGNYVVTVRDLKGCKDFVSVTITQPNILQALIDSVHNILCNGGTTGAVYITVTGGNSPYTFLWSNGAATEDITGITAGTYNVAVTDSKGCTTSTGATLSQPLPLFLNIASYQNLKCYNDSTGKIDVTANGGVPPYSFVWSNGATTEDIANLKAGNYSVVVTDANGCQQNIAQTITEPAQLASATVVTNELCFGGNNGGIDLTASGGTTPYSYLWSNGATTEDVPGIVSGTYTVVITDVNGCVTSNTKTVTQPALLQLATVVTNVACSGTGTGAIDLTVTGGTPGFGYTWDNNLSATEDQTGLSSGTYNVTVSDNNGCNATASATISQPAQPLNGSLSATDVTCNGASNGTVNLTLTGGTQPYSYLWSNTETTEDLTGLGPNLYTVTATDANGCSFVDGIAVNEPAVLLATIQGTDVSCFGGNNGAADLTVTGGNGGYTYLWSNFAGTEDLSGLTAGNYVVIVNDSKGCQAITTVTISQPALLVITASTTNILCNGGNNGAIDITVAGGAGNNTFSWSNLAVTEDLNGITAGTYSVTVTDANSCTATATYTITEPAALTLSGVVTHVTCNGAANGAVNITVGGGATPYTYAWTNSAVAEDLSGLSGGTYDVTITDANACNISASYTVNEPTAITSSIVGTDVSCHGAGSGAADLTVGGGTAPYSYLWSNFINTEDLANLNGGTYYVIITDANGCQKRDSVIINEFLALGLSTTVTNVLCHGSATGAIDLTVTGGTGTYTYSWTGGGATEDTSGLVAGTYNVTVTDGNGCSATTSATITQPAGLVLNATTTNVGCAGGANGSVDITVQGGVFPYSFNWSNTATTEDVNGLSGGTYSVTVTDANLCTITASYIITEPSAIVSSIVGTNILCHGAGTGAADLTVSGGTLPYTYLWSNFQSTQDLSNLNGGTYYVIIKDANGCEKRDSVVITEPAALALSTTVTNVLCHGSATGAIDLTVTGGTGTYTYSWTGGGATEDTSGLVAGTYNVTVTDGNGCSATTSATITQPAGLVLNATTTNVGCAGGANGSVDITVQGGVFPYSFNWSNTATTEDVNGLSGGTYSVTVTDANLCTITASYIITEPSAIVSSIVGTNILCHGAGTGAADLTVSGGTLPYTYLWSNFQSTQDLSNLNGGTYYVIIKDANGCEKRDSVVITEPAALALSTTVTNVLCHGSATGAIDLTVTGGTGTYTYSWTGGGATEDTSGLVAGTYNVTVTDGNGCSATTSATITQPAGLVLNATTTNVGCAGGANGSVDITVQGGVFPYSFNWSNTATTEDVNGLSGGTYSVTVTDANLCTITASYIITEPSAIVSSIVGTNILCHGAGTGAADLTVSGGTLPYTYLWSNFQSTQDLSNLNGGTYYVIIKDANGCEKRDSVVITEPAALALSTTVTNVLCHGSATGAIDLTVTGGTGTYTYSWTGGGATEDTSGLVAGTYNVTVTDGNGCSATTSATITQPAGLVLNATTTNVGCAGGANGSVDITVQGGVFPYSFNWSNTATTEDVNGLSGGTYSVTVTDANLCTITASYIITEPSAIVSSIVGTNILCHGAGTGAADLTVSGGTLPYTYLWSNFQSTQDLSNLNGGTYYVIIKDANGCEKRDSVVITEPAALALSTTVTNVLCHGSATGAIDLTVTGGTGTYTYSWTGGGATEDTSGLVAGTYNVTVTDGNGCSATTSATITQPAGLVLNATTTNVGCAGGANGSVDITVQGGVFPYSFNWSNTATTEDVNGLSGGTYSVTVTDANLCTITASYIITEPSAITSSIAGTNVLCFGGNNGAADLTVGGGTSPYSYLWSNFHNTQDLVSLTAGTYFVIVTDANGCDKRDSVIITQPTPIVLSSAVTNVLCNGGATGGIDLTVTGGTGIYDYSWSNGDNTQDLTNVVAGTYTVTVKDANNCTATASATISQPAALVLTGTATNVHCFGGNDGLINTTVVGGTLPYTFVWSNGPVTEDIQNLTVGTYTVTVTDGHACTSTATYVITAPPAITSSIVGTDVTCFGAGNGSADLTVGGGVPGYTFLWSNFKITEDVSNLDGGAYFVIITDASGCTHRDSVIIDEPSPLVLSTQITQITCFNANDGAIDLTVAGGTQPYVYDWNNGIHTEDLSNLSGATYIVTVTDNHGCTATTNALIINPSNISTNVVTHNPLCSGDVNGSIDLIATGGTPNYTFDWSTGAHTEDIGNIGAGVYSITITDAHLCVRVDSFVITEPGPLFTSGFIRNVTCFGNNDGCVDITAYGGTLPYTYLWSTQQSTEDICGLSGSSNFVTVTDFHGCSVVSLYQVVEPALLTLNVTGTNATCFGSSTGTLTSHPAGGSLPYEYLWDDFATDSLRSNVAAGHYVLLLTDSNGCHTFDSIDLAEPTEIKITGLVTNANCFGASTGAVDISVTGGTPTYSYGWSDGTTVTQDLNVSPAASYTVTVTDANLCEKTADFTITQPLEINLTLLTHKPTCSGASNGSVSVVAIQGITPYTYLWSTSPVQQTTATASDLFAGSYTVTVTDSRGCTVQATDSLIGPTPILVSTSAIGSKCFNVNDGVVTATVSGGLQPYVYQLNGATQDTNVYNSLAPGHYVILVTDANSCQGTSAFNIASASQMSVQLTASQELILTGMQTQLIATAVADTTIIGYMWSPDSLIDFSICGDPNYCTNPFAAPRTSTTFTVTVMNADSCTATDTITIYVDSKLSAFVPNAFSPNGDGLNDRFEFDVLGATNLDVEIYDRWGQAIYVNHAQQNGITGNYGWDGKVDGQLAPFDTYIWKMKVTYFDGVVKDEVGTFTLMK